MRSQLAPFHSSIGQMAAHEYGELVVVSFLWKLQVPPRQPRCRRRCSWSTPGSATTASWQVVTRYTAPVGDARQERAGRSARRAGGREKNLSRCESMRSRLENTLTIAGAVAAVVRGRAGGMVLAARRCAGTRRSRRLPPPRGMADRPGHVPRGCSAAGVMPEPARDAGPGARRRRPPGRRPGAAQADGFVPGARPGGAAGGARAPIAGLPEAPSWRRRRRRGATHRRPTISVPRHARSACWRANASAPRRRSRWPNATSSACWPTASSVRSCANACSAPRWRRPGSRRTIRAAWPRCANGRCSTWRRSRAQELDPVEIRERRIHGAALEARRDEDAQACAGQMIRADGGG